jgi:hypothetical protein
MRLVISWETLLPAGDATGIGAAAVLRHRMQDDDESDVEAFCELARAVGQTET